jgi:hypothetical protein
MEDKVEMMLLEVRKVQLGDHGWRQGIGYMMLCFSFFVYLLPRENFLSV